MSTSQPPNTSSKANRKIKFPAYIDAKDRLESFSKFPAFSHKCPRILCSAGFFYNGIDEHVTCFNCGYKKTDKWQRREDPWKRHAFDSPNCPFIKMTKGSDFIETVDRVERENYCPRIFKEWYRDVRNRQKRDLRRLEKKKLKNAEKPTPE